MNSDHTDPSELLDLARQAHSLGDYAVAVERYEYFFDHALDGGPHSFYGVRLSYCLGEWASLGEQFPHATDRLKLKKESALRLLESSREPERFHDYVAICGHLTSSDEALRTFLSYHESDRDLSQSIVRFIWEDLVKAEEWDVCSYYVADADKEYDVAVERFDATMRICNSDPELGGEEFAKQIEEWYVRDVQNLVLVLRSAGRASEAESVLKRVDQDCEERDRPKMLEAVYAWPAL